MSVYSRYGIYAVPKGALFATGSAWLGWDSAAGRPVPHPDLAGLPAPAETLTATPRKYGIHGTIKPPFRLAEGTSEQAAREAAFAAADVPLHALNALENDHPLPLILAYRSFVARGLEPSENARDALQRAAELAPFDMQLGLVVGLMHIHDGRIAQARAALQPLASHPHGGARSAQIRDLITMLEGRKEGEGFAMLELIAQEMR